MSCWGTSYFGYGPEASAPAQPVAGLSGVTAVATAFGRACALLAGGRVACWDPLKPGKPVQVPGITTAVAISAGSGQCALLSDGTVTCWEGTAAPIPVPGISGASAISLAGLERCVVVSGTVSCWIFAQPVTAPGISTATAVNAGGLLCVLLSAGSVTCSTVTYDQSTLMSIGPPVPVRGITGAVAIGSRFGGKCALLRTGTLKCWNLEGTDPATPVAGVSRAIAFDAGRDHMCAIVAGGSVTCWGDNSQGQLGTDRGWLPRRVVGLN